MRTASSSGGGGGGGVVVGKGIDSEGGRTGGGRCRYCRRTTLLLPLVTRTRTLSSLPLSLSSSSVQSSKRSGGGSGRLVKLTSPTPLPSSSHSTSSSSSSCCVLLGPQRRLRVQTMAQTSDRAANATPAASAGDESAGEEEGELREATRDGDDGCWESASVGAGEGCLVGVRSTTATLLTLVALTKAWLVGSSATA